MKRRNGFLLAALLMISGLLSGCGTKLYEMTEEEQQMIASSAAYFVAKHNSYQQDGAAAVAPVKEEEETEIESAPQETEVQQEGETNQQGQVTAIQQEEMEMLSLAEAIGYGKELSVSYGGYSIADDYKEGDYSVYADDGNTFLVLKFSLENKGTSPVQVDVLKNNSSFRCSYNGTEQIPAEVTFLLNYFSTYQGTVEAGAKVDTVLLFQISKGSVDSMGDISLTVITNGEQKSVKL